MRRAPCACHLNTGLVSHCEVNLLAQPAHAGCVSRLPEQVDFTSFETPLTYASLLVVRTGRRYHGRYGGVGVKIRGWMRVAAKNVKKFGEDIQSKVIDM